MTIGRQVRAFAPGRVNLIGDHTDYTGGLALPIALEMGITIEGTRTGKRVTLATDIDEDGCDLPLTLDDPSTVTPSWARYVAAIIDDLRPDKGLRGTITSTLAAGAGLSSSAALSLASALALGFVGDKLDLARVAQRAEHRAVGVPCGLLDQIASVFGQRDHALLIDCTSLTVQPVAIADGADIVILHPGAPRQLATSQYAQRRAACEAAQEIVGPLRDATLGDLDAIADVTVRARARHVINENQRVTVVADAIAHGDWETAGDAMWESHESLRRDFAVSTDALDALVNNLRETPGVYGARLTGAGFGGSVVALTEPGAVPFVTPIRAADGARLL